MLSWKILKLNLQQPSSNPLTNSKTSQKELRWLYTKQLHFLFTLGNFIDVYAAGGGLEGPSSVR